MSISSVIAGLSSSNSCTIYGSLVELRTRCIKEKDGIALLREQGGLEGLLAVLKQRDDKILNITLSIIGNCCMEDKSRLNIVELDGIKVLADVFVRATAVSICNRSCRTLANLALERQCCDSIHSLGTVLPHLVATLIKITDPECLQTYLRAIRLLADTADHRLAVISSDGLKSICSVLKDSNSQPILSAALKALVVITTQLTDECIQQLLGTDILPRLVELGTTPPATLPATIPLLLSFSQRPELRPALGAAGFVERLLKAIVDGSSDDLPLMNALCHFCQEAVNRVRVRDSGALLCMLQWLESDHYNRIHNRLISALVCFLYDEPSMDLLLSNGVVPLLITHLRRCMAVGTAVSGKSSKSATSATVQESITQGSRFEQFDATSIKDTNHEEVDENEVSIVNDADEINDKTDAGPKVGDGMVNEVQIEKDSTGVDQEESSIVGEKQQAVSKSIGNTTEWKACDAVIDSDEMKGGASESSSRLGNTPEHPQAMCKADKDMQHDAVMDSLVDHINKTKKADNFDAADSKSEVRYSIDSPTYKALADVGVIEGFKGPRNIMESAEYYGRASPHGLYGYGSPPRYSPMSTLSYPSPEWSPDSSPLRSLSPVDLQFSPCMPTISGSGASPLPDESSSLHWVPSEMVSREPLEWSPVHNPIQALGCASPTTEPSTPLRWNSENTTEAQDCVASSWDDDIFYNPDKDTADWLNSDLNPFADLISSLPIDSSLNDDFSPSGSTSSSASKRGPLPGRRKRSFSVETMSKIRKVVAASPSHSAVDVCDMMSPVVVERSERNSPRDPDRHYNPAKMTEHNILVLLSRVSYMTDPSLYLVSEDTLRGLLHYVATSTRPLSRAARILRRLTRNTHCFEPIIMNMMPMLIDMSLGHRDPMPPSTCSKKQATVAKHSSSNVGEHDRQTESSYEVSLPIRHNDTVELKRCLLTNLSLLSESRYGRGVISHILLTGSQANKCKCAILLPFLCRSRELRRKMLLDFSGLKLLLKSLADSSSDTFPIAVRSLSNLFSSLSIKSEEFKHLQTTSSETCSTEDLSAGQPVTFVMDDDTCVTAQREKLIRRSSVFAAMLDGHYCECVQEEVRISDVNPAAFHILVDFLQEDRLSSLFPSASHSTPSVEPLTVCLDVLALSNQYHVPELQQHISTLLCEHFLNEENVCLLLQFAELHNSVWLAQRCVCFVFIHPMSHQCRLALNVTLMDGAQCCDIRKTMHRLLVSNIL